MRILNYLIVSAYGMHVADQIALVTVPLVAALVFDAAPETIGILVALQAMAHLVGSIPSGLIVDQVRSNRVVIAAAAVAVLGFLGVALSVYYVNLTGFAVTVLVSGFGIVLFVLAILSIIPTVVEPHNLARANARLEIPRAVTAFAVPLTVGTMIDIETARLVFFLATAAAAAAMIVLFQLPLLPASNRAKTTLRATMLRGGKLVTQHPLLRPIALCAIFWNLAFSALLVVMVPLIIDVYRADAGLFGIALSAFGAATIVGSWLAGRFSSRISPNIILLFGPASSVVAALALLAMPTAEPALTVYGAFFVLGFGPSMWLIAQNSIRQLVTPTAILGSVNAVIQTAIYGVRPLGALIGGVITGSISPSAGIGFVTIAYGCSLAAAVFSQLRGVKSYTDLSQVTQ